MLKAIVVALAATAKTAMIVSGMIKVKMASQIVAAISFRDAMSIQFILCCVVVATSVAVGVFSCAVKC